MFCIHFIEKLNSLINFSTIRNLFYESIIMTHLFKTNFHFTENFKLLSLRHIYAKSIFDSQRQTKH